tara:strand:+ start:1878 stop:2057 length:180 start_codon:yes stop_codon:yes gene_type:complete
MVQVFPEQPYDATPVAAVQQEVPLVRWAQVQLWSAQLQGLEPQSEASRELQLILDPEFL